MGYRQYSNFAGGTVSRHSPLTLSMSQSPNAKNVWTFGEDGSVVSRNGYRALNDTGIASKPQVGGHILYLANGTKKFITAVGTDIYQGTGGAFTVIGGGALTGDALQTHFITMNNTMYGCNGNATDGIISWDGVPANAKATDVGGANCRPHFLAYHQGRAWALIDGDTLKCSALDDATTWTGADTFQQQVWTQDGGNAVGLLKYGDLLLVFKQNGVSFISGYSPRTYKLNQLISTKGTPSSRGFGLVGGIPYCMSYNGVERMNGMQFEPVPISGPVEDKIDSINDGSMDAVAFGRYKDRFLLVGFDNEDTGTAYNDEVLVYDTKYGTWNWWDGINAAYWLTGDGDDDRGELYHGSADSVGKMWLNNTGLNDAQLNDGSGGVAIDQYWTMPPFPFNRLFRITVLDRLAVEAYTSGGSLAITIFDSQDSVVQTKTIAFPSSGETWKSADGSVGTFNWGDLWATVEYEFKETLLQAQGRRTQLRIGNQNSGEGFIFRACEIEYHHIGRKKMT